MAKQIIIATHSGLSDGFVKALNFIYGDKMNIHIIQAFTVDKNPNERFLEIVNNISSNDKIIVLTDLTAGSVNKMIAQELVNHDFYLISGINLAILLEIALTSEDDINDEFIRKVVEDGKEEITYVNDIIFRKNDKVTDEDDFLK